jgi:hypothetical protein
VSFIPLRFRNTSTLAFLCLLAGWPVAAAAQGRASQTLWQRLDRVPANRPAAEVWVKPDQFAAVTLDRGALQRELARAPMEVMPGVVQSDFELTLPMPDGSEQRFRVVESPVMAPELAAKFPEIRTYAGQGIDDPAATVRLDLTPAGFHAQILTPHGAVYIDPHFRDESVYASYYKRDHRRLAQDFTCLVTAESGTESLRPAASGDLARSGGNLRTYRLACAANGEYTAFHGGTVSAGLAAVVTAVNRVNGVYQTELAIRLVLVANNDLIIYTSSGTDPYSNSSGSTMLSQNQTTLDSVIGSGNYDIGHVFSTGGGGIAGLGVVCVGGSKARGVTGSPSPVGDAFWIDYVAHEMGHQFGANHTFNSTTGNCSGNRNASTAYEPGSGSTIMAYAGICGSDDLQPNSDPYFHSISFDEIISFTTSGSGSLCPVTASTGNTAPTVNAGGNFTIPASTPFILTATGSDANGDALTYCWEERDLGPSVTLTTGDNGSSPLFRVFNPTTNNWRTFPRLANILNNTTTTSERLPTTSRTMNFRVTARDNRSTGGGVNTDDMSVTVVSTAGPFTVTGPGSGGTFSNSLTVAWNVANTAASPINAANVTITLSTNGGLTFPITLLASTPNDGSQVVVLPNLTTTQARLKVQGAGNIFFAVNAGNFTILPAVPQPLVSLSAFTLMAENCGAGNGAVDPGETVTVLVGLRNEGSAPTTNVVATLLTGGGVTAPSAAQVFGTLLPGGTGVTQAYTFTATGDCGGLLNATFQLQDGPASLGTVAQNQVLGGFTNLTVSFTNAGSISVPASGNRGKGGPYPATIPVSGLGGTITKVAVTLEGVGHSFPDDMDILLVGPGGQKVMLLSDVGGGNSASGLALTFAADAAAALPDASALGSGTYLPTDYDAASDSFASPAPAGPYGASLSVFNGTSPNGTWSLFTQDDQQQDSGEIIGGWRLQISTAQGSCCSPVGNNPPNFPPVAAQSVDELQSLVFTNNATDPDGQVLSYTLAGAPTNATVDALSGVFQWTPTEIQGPATNVFLVIATDNGTPNLSATQTVSVVVNEVNAAPELAGPGDVTLPEGSTINFTNNASDSDFPPNQLSFLLVSAPTNATLNSVSGVFTWATGELDGPGTNLISIAVVDSGSPSASATQSFLAIILESNQPPVLAPIASRVVHAGAIIAFTNSATDSDWPTNALGFSLDPGGPPAATLDAAGVYSWPTTDADAGTTNAFSARVTDDGLPALDATRNFTITVQPRPLVSSIVLTNDLVTLTWSAIPGEWYRLQTNGVADVVGWDDASGDIQAVGDEANTTTALEPTVRFFRVRWLAP